MTELTSELIYNDYKDHVSGRKYWLIFIIMAIPFLGIGAMGGNIWAGVFMLAAMGIYMICSTISTNRALARLKKGDYVIYEDMLTYKHASRSYKRQSTKFLIQSEKLFRRKFNTNPFIFDNVEEGVQFYAVYSRKKLIRLYGEHKYTLSPELYSKIKR